MKSILLKIVLITFFTFSFDIAFCQTQDSADYKIVNYLANHYNKRKRSIDTTCYLYEFKFEDIKQFYFKDTKDWNGETYFKNLFQGMLSDSLSKYKSKITKRKVKKMFSKQDASKINYKTKKICSFDDVKTDSSLKNEKYKDFLHYTKPLFIDKNLFLVFHFSHTYGGGAGAHLYKTNDNYDSFTEIKYSMIIRYGIFFR